MLLLNYQPVPALIVIAPSTFVGCVPQQSIFFDNLSVPVDETYDIFWDFGDGGISTDISPTHNYEQTGVYSVSLDITSPIGCETDTTFVNLITVQPSPEAGFGPLPLLNQAMYRPYCFICRINLIDASTMVLGLWNGQYLL